MYNVNCPSCGAEVRFRSAASIMAVCEYCQSTVVKDADAVKDIGKMSSVLEDFSPIQIGTGGVYQGVNFSVVGRIQLKYDAGFWNEWYVLFDDGQPGWLSDASGQYVFTRELPNPPALPGFDSLHPGQKLNASGQTFIASDVRTAECVAGQGELPFQVGQGWVARVADFRAQQQFLTLDYSDADTPTLYQGQATTLEELKCSFLRTSEQLQDSAGRYRGKIQALGCPSCGGSIHFPTGMATQLVCPSCHSQLDCSTDQTQVLAKHNELTQIHTTLALGDEGKIDGQTWRIIGLMRCQTVVTDPEDAEAPWTEYLLFNEQKGFLWLAESNDGWEKTQVLNVWPEIQNTNSVKEGGQNWTLLYDYQVEVIYAAGAFNWRVQIHDQNRVGQFAQGQRRLYREQNEHEITWSRAEMVAEHEVLAWFGKKIAPQTVKPAGGNASFQKTVAIVISVIYCVLNLPLFIVGGFGFYFATLIVMACLWVPVWLARSST